MNAKLRGSIILKAFVPCRRPTFINQIHEVIFPFRPAVMVAWNSRLLPFIENLRCHDLNQVFHRECLLDLFSLVQVIQDEMFGIVKECVLIGIVESLHD